MGRKLGSSCKLCRREGLKLFLKGDRCYTEKCSFERRSYPPGQHGQNRPKFSEFGTQLREKQKIKRVYGLMEEQTRLFFKKAGRQKGIKGDNLLILLERRLDNVVYRLGFATSRNESRQLVRHCHFIINGKKVNIPSYIVKQGDVVELKQKSRAIPKINESLNTVARRSVPQWLELDRENYKGIVKTLPTREDITMPIQEQLIVEFYSR